MEQKYTIRAKSRKGVTKPHFWIEGKRLEAAGFVSGARYNTITSHAGFALMLDPNGKKKVSGNVGRPIIDIVGRDLTKSLLRIGDDVLITYQETLITVEALWDFSVDSVYRTEK
tara:strand:+ start:629 stop:970 length:342 start_codon:yes stop_codon:yes gene_type:complete